MSSENQSEETVIGVHESGIQLEEGLNTSLSRNYCASCKKKIHCYVKVDRETHEAKIHITCKSADCECKCRTHYPCKSCGMLHPYGETCLKMDSRQVQNPKADKEINDINAQWRKLQAEKQQNMPQIKHD